MPNHLEKLKYAAVLKVPNNALLHLRTYLYTLYMYMNEKAPSEEEDTGTTCVAMR